MAHATRRKISLGIAVFAVFLPVKAWCAQQELNLQPLAPEAASLSDSGENSAKNEASKNSSVLLPAIVLITFNGLDIHSTSMAIRNGSGHEANAAMQFGTGGQIAMKAASSAIAIYVAHRMSRRHPTLAKVMLYAGSAAIGSIAVRNYRVARR